MENTPITMTRAQYQATYGQAPVPSLNPITNTIDAAKASIGQIGSGISQTKEGANNTSVAQGAEQIGRGALNEASGAISTALSPIAGILGSIAHIPVGNGETVGSRIQKNGIDDIVNRIGISDWKPLQQFMMKNPNAGEVVSNLINIGGALAGGDKAPEIKGAVAETASKVSDAAASAAEGMAKPIADTLKSVTDQLPKLNPTEEQVIADRSKGYEDLSRYASVSNAIEKAQAKGFDPIKDLSSDDRFNPEVSSDGKIDSAQAVKNLNAYIKPVAQVEREAIVKEGARVSYDKFAADVQREISPLADRGSSFSTIENKIKSDLEVYRRNVDANGTISLEKLDDIKNAKYGISNFNNEDAQIADKAVARIARKTIIDNTKNADIKALNQKMSQYYSARDVLDAIDGKVVKGGRLGKYFARTIGGVAGSHFGPFGTILGGFAGDTIEGKILQGKFGNSLGTSGETTPSIVDETRAKIDQAPMQLQSGNTRGMKSASGMIANEGGNTAMKSTAATIQNNGERVMPETLPPKNINVNRKAGDNLKKK